jgi:uncharacterized membrane protein
MTDLGADLAGDSMATGINSDGVIAGFYEPADGESVAVVWVDDSPVELPSLGGPRSEALAINNEGLVAGKSRTGPDEDESSASHATLWTPGERA